jgi:hypothetical protein
MKNELCIFAAILLLLAFPAVNLFLPYALLVLGLFIGLGFLCGRVRRHTRGAECPLGFC